MNLKKLIKFSLDNYFISIFFAAILFVSIVSVLKLFIVKPTYVYARVKMGQGLWWASTARPSIWFVQNIKRGDVERDLVGSPIAQILGVRYYPWYTSNQYDVYLTVKLKVSGNKKTKKYSFKRSTIGVGSPIDFEFPNAQFSATVTDLENDPIKDTYIEKTIYLTKRYAYPWEYDGIKIGDKFFDGENTVFEVLDKSSSDTAEVITQESTKILNPQTTELRRYITVKAKIKVKKVGEQYVFGEEQVLSLGKPINISTSNFSFTDYVIAEIDK